MKILIHKLLVITKKTKEEVNFSQDVTFIHGPISSGKSTTGRLVDYCLGGGLERTPALRSEFLGAHLSATLGEFEVQFERSAVEGSPVRVTWDNGKGSKGALNAPLEAGAEPILEEEIFNLSDLIFHFCGIKPVKVRKSKADPDSPLVRLGFRDLMWYCFLHQNELDSSFFQIEHPFKANKSRDVMRFVTGLHSDRMNELERKLGEFIQTQRAKREAVIQIRQFMGQFNLASEAEFGKQLDKTRKDLETAIAERDKIDQHHKNSTHALEPIRIELRKLNKEMTEIEIAVEDLNTRIQQQDSLRSEIITAKLKSSRAKQAVNTLKTIDFVACPRCESSISSSRFSEKEACCLCGQTTSAEKAESVLSNPELNRDLDARIDDLSESVERHRRELGRTQIRKEEISKRQQELDQKLTKEIDRYDTAYTSNARATESKVAELEERVRSLNKLAQMPAAISALQKEAAALQADIDQAKNEIALEQNRLIGADSNINSIANAFRQVMLDVGFPGVYDTDKVQLDPRNWLPYVKHGEQEWSFADAGSGGKKTLFNVCYMIAVHRVALEKGLPLPTILIIDSPTKNIARDENPELVDALYKQIYRLAHDFKGSVQVLLIDSHLVKPTDENFEFIDRRMPPPLISYYEGP